MIRYFNILSLFLFLFVTCSCSHEDLASKNGLFIFDVDDGSLEIAQDSNHPQTYYAGRSYFSFRVRSQGDWVNKTLASVEGAYGHVNYMDVVASKDWVDFYETKVYPYVRKVKEEFESPSYPGRDCTSYGNANYLLAYVRSKPGIVADKPLFGRSAGTDLSDLMNVFGQPAVRRNEDGFKMDVGSKNGRVLMSWEDFFVPGTLMPTCMDVELPSFPEELNSYGVVHLTISFSLTIEHLWEYVLAKEKDESAELQKVEKDISFTVELKKP